MLILIDGIIATAALYVAIKLYPNLLDYCIFTHQSQEKGHQKLLNELKAQPLLEDFGGESLTKLLPAQSLEIATFMRLAIRLATVVNDIHHQNVIHKDINPSNIIWNPNTHQIKIIDFGISSVLSREHQTIRNINSLEGTLTYMSPEQTGRINRAMDYRTDFYSLGATFYQMVTQHPPFDADDAIELVHCHIAKTPQSPHELNPNIPAVISKIILKLLAKTAEERYQSALGLKADLQKCLTQFESTGDIADFELGQFDISDKFQIPQKLYGRENETETYLNTFERVSTKGEAEMILIAGYSGIGKSALVQEIYKPLTKKQGYLISGKFEQFQRNIPYSAIVNAFSELVRQMLTERKKSRGQTTFSTDSKNRGQITLSTDRIKRGLSLFFPIFPNLHLTCASKPCTPNKTLN
jgi:serine/threonine protein kinase